MTRLKPIAHPAIVLCLCLVVFPSFAQDKAKNTLGKVTPSDFNLPNLPITDSNTTAVILADKGETHYIGNRTGWFSCVYTRQTRIKVIDKKAFDLATVKIYLDGQQKEMEKLSNVSASTFNLDQRQISQTKLDEKDIFRNKLDKDRTEVKFTLPAVKEGSIIEYSYTITSDYWWIMPPWEFQFRKYPCLYSEYQVEIPQTISFVLVRQGVHPYAVDNGSIGRVSYTVTVNPDKSSLANLDQDAYVSANTVKHDWVMRDIPAFGNEPYLTTPENYIDKIAFQLSGTHNNSEESTDYHNNWAKATDELLGQERFGGALEQDDNRVDEFADKIGVGDADRLALAKAVYYYMSQHFTCTENWRDITTTLPDVIRKGGGTVGDINLLLIAVLRKKGFFAEPVVLSTRDHGFNFVHYPILERLNYVIVRLILDGRTYYLDAAHPELGFGQLADECYNGPARIISKQDSGSVYFDADSLKERSTTLVMMTSTDKGLEGSWQSTLGTQQSYETRKNVREHGQQQFFKDIQTQYGDDLAITNGGIDSLSLPEEPVKVHYEFVLKQQPGLSLIYLSPMLGDAWRKNPFEAAERKYPIELPYSMDENYIFSMDIPQGYAVDELPKSARVGLNGDQGQFEYLIAQQGDQIQMRCRLRLNKAWFPATDYSSLRDFFGYVVRKEAEQIVLKKK